MDGSEFLAVYGTLMQGHLNHTTYLAPKKPIFSGYHPIKAKMFSNGRYPMLVKSKFDSDIFLEIYQINMTMILEIDQLELPFGYKRLRYDIEEIGDVWLYFYKYNKPPSNFIPVNEGKFISKIPW